MSLVDKFFYCSTVTRQILCTVSVSDFVVLFEKVTKDRRGLEGKHVRLDRVPVCSCIKVKRHKETSDESIALYFANMRRSGGGPVSLVERIGKDQVLVHFENPSSK